MSTTFYTTLPRSPGDELPLHAAFDEGDISAARGYGRRYWPGSRHDKGDHPQSEDFLSVISNYNNGTAVDAGYAERLMRVTMRDARHAVSGIQGATTFAGALTFGNGDPADIHANGVVIGIAGDSPILVQDDFGQTVQVSEAQETPAGFLVNAMGGDVGDSGSGDVVAVLTVAQLQALGLRGNAFRLIVASDGLVQQAATPATGGGYDGYLEGVKREQAARVSVLAQHAGTTQAEALVTAALDAGSDDDISAISLRFPRARQQAGAFVCDGAGGHANSAEVAAAAVQEINVRMAQAAKDLGAPDFVQLPGRAMESAAGVRPGYTGPAMIDGGERVALPRLPVARVGVADGIHPATQLIKRVDLPAVPVAAPPLSPANREPVPPPVVLPPGAPIPVGDSVRVRGAAGESASQAAVERLAASKRAIAAAAAEGMGPVARFSERRRVGALLESAAAEVRTAQFASGSSAAGHAADAALHRLLTGLGFVTERRVRGDLPAGLAVRAVPGNVRVAQAVIGSLGPLVQHPEAIASALNRDGRPGMGVG